MMAQLWKPSGTQCAVLAALADLDEMPDVAARDVAERTRQSTDGAAYTLRSLVTRNMVEIRNDDGDRQGYRLTPPGRAVLARLEQS